MYCKNCGKEIDENVAFCHYCGTATEVNSDAEGKEEKNSDFQEVEIVPKATSNKKIPYGKKDKKKFIIIGVAVLLLIGIIGSIAGTIEQSPAEPSVEKSNIIAQNEKNTIMIYMDGTNLVDYLVMSIEESLSCGIDTEKNNVLFYTGGSEDWDKYDIPSDKDSIYIIEDDELVALEQREPHSMAEPETLEYFMSYCIENYPAQKYSLILNDHGGGPNIGVCSDEKNNDIMAVLELSEALENAGFVGESKLETIMFDACLMASVEVAAALKDHANYMIGSENPSPALGPDYSFLEEFNTAKSGEDIGRAYIDKFYEKSDYVKRKTNDPADITYSCIDLSKIDGVIEKADVFFKIAGKDVKEYYPYFSKTREITKSVADEGGDPNVSQQYYYDLIDLYDFASNHKEAYEEESEALLQALDDAIVYNRSSSYKMNGLTFYSPFRSDLDSDYSDVCFSESYADYISAFLKGKERESSFGSVFGSTNPEMDIRAIDGIRVLMPLTEEQADDFLYGEYYVFCKPKNLTDGATLEDDEYMFVSNGFDVALNGEKLEAKIDNKGCYVSSNGNDLLCPVYAIKNGEDIVNFTMVSLTHVQDIAGSTEDEELDSLVEAIENMKLDVGKLYLDISGDTVKMGPIYLVSDTNEYQRSPLTVDYYDEISFNTFARKTAFDSDSKLRPFNEWTSLTNKQLSHTHKTNDISMEMKPLAQDADYFVMLVAHDIYGNVNYSGIVPLKTE